MKSRKYLAGAFLVVAIVSFSIAVPLYINFYNLKRDETRARDAIPVSDEVKHFAALMDALLERPSEMDVQIDPAELAKARDSTAAFADFSTQWETLKASTEDFEAVNETLGEAPELWNDDQVLLLTGFLDSWPALLPQIKVLAELGGPYRILDVNLGPDLGLPHLATLRDMVRLLRADAALRCEDAPDCIAENLRAQARLIGALQQEPILLSQLVAVAMHHMAFDTLRLLPQETTPTQLLSELKAEFALLGKYAGFRDSLWSEAILLLYDGHPDALESGQDYVAIPSGLERVIWRHNRIRVLEEYALLYGVLERPYAEIQDQAEAFDQRAAEYAGTFYEAASGYVESMRSILRIQSRRSAMNELTLLGLSIEAYHNEHGVYPESLEALSDATGIAGIHDPFSSAPYRYEVRDNSFLLYSVADNLSDESGRRCENFLLGDLVWRGPEAPCADLDPSGN